LEVPRAGRSGPRCEACRLVELLPAGQAGALEGALRAGEWSAGQLADELLNGEHRLVDERVRRLVKVQSLMRHRRMLQGKPNGCRG
jgi:hypothetical protein